MFVCNRGQNDCFGCPDRDTGFCPMEDDNEDTNDGIILPKLQNDIHNSVIHHEALDL